jgi:hypothetical protein
MVSWIRCLSSLRDSFSINKSIIDLDLRLRLFIIDKIIFLSYPCSFRLLISLIRLRGLRGCALNNHTSSIVDVIRLSPLMMTISWLLRLFLSTQLNNIVFCRKLLIKRLTCQLLILIYNGIFHIWIIKSCFRYNNFSWRDGIYVRLLIISWFEYQMISSKHVLIVIKYILISFLVILAIIDCIIVKKAVLVRSSLINNNITSDIWWIESFDNLRRMYLYGVLIR